MKRTGYPGKTDTRTLNQEVLEVFDHACDQGDLEVAEHLLRALEIFALRSGDDGNLDAVYIALAQTLLGKH